METLIDLFELSEPVVEKYRDSYRACVVTPRESTGVSLTDEGDRNVFGRSVPTAAPASSERRLRARLWATED